MEELCSIIARESQCPLCQKELSEPKVLPCSHSFCLQCLLNPKSCLVKSSPQPTTKCPECAHETSLPPGGVEALPTNLAMASLLSAVNAFKVERNLEVKSPMVWKFRSRVIDLPSRDCGDGMTATLDNRMAVVDRFGGIHLYFVDGNKETILPNMGKIKGMTCFQDGRFAVLFSDNTIRLYDSCSNCLDVRFKTLDIEDGGCGVLAGDEVGKVYVAYTGGSANRIQVFTQDGGKPIKEIMCNGFKPKQLIAIAPSDLLAVDVRYKSGGDVSSSKVVLLDESGRQKKVIEKEGVHAQVALSHDDSILISWLKRGRVIGQGWLTVEKYSKEVEEIVILISDFEVSTSMCPSYHLQEFSSSALAFCTADKLYIFEKDKQFKEI